MTAQWQTEIEVVHGIGLHARPSVIFTRLAKSFPCTIEIEVNGDDVWLNGKSIVKVMGAKIRKGSVLKIRADDSCSGSHSGAERTGRTQFRRRQLHGRNV